MRIFKTLAPLAVLLLLVSCQPAVETVQPPVAKIIPQKLETNGDVRIDNYYWLKERDNPDVIAYLKAENEYTDKIMAHTKDLQEKLFQEIKGRVKEDDSTVPYKLGDYFYYARFEEGKDYAVYCRKKGSLDAQEEIMVDGNALAEGHGFFSINVSEISPGQDILAYAVDIVGRRFYTISFKNLSTGEVLTDVIPNVTGNLVWANDNKTIFYVKQNPETLRWFQVFKHVLGTNPAQDPLVYQEDDDTFETYVVKSKSKKYLGIFCNQTLSTEFRYLDADKPDSQFTIFLPREKDHLYYVDHFGDKFLIRTNWEAKNYRLMETPVNRTGKENWKEIIPHRDDVLLEEMEIFKDFLVLSERKEGLIQMRIIPWKGGEEHYLDFGEPTYLAYVSTNPEFDTQVLRYGYTSLTTPNSTYDYNMVTREKTLMKQEEVLGGFSPDNYLSERLYATARDGVKVPISIVYRKDFVKDGTHPLLEYGYGSYGASMDATFNSSRLSLLDRGFAYAIAHIRGGEEMGRWWYEDGKLLKKKNTFTDFIDCAEYLITEKYTSADKLFAMGGSAGGLLMGAVVNMRPDLFKGVIAKVPYVDVITTMLDPSIPLTTSEYDEWGNPNVKEYYDYMLSYSPYDQVEAKDYPNMLVTTSLHDSQVQYWEPAKWVAKLRALKTDKNILILKTNMEAGHGGSSGRYKRFRDTAFDFAFILDLLGIKE
jgi:oligopeptidase B